MPDYIHPNGFSYTQFEVEDAASSFGLSLEDFISNEGIKVGGGGVGEVVPE